MAEMDVGRQRIRFDELGAGSPVVLLHSSGLSALQWRRLAQQLSAEHRVLVPDLIGYGGSAPWQGPGAFHYREDVRVAEALAERAGAPVHLVGHSYGGLLALVTALEGRVAVRSLSVYEPVAFGVLHSAHDAEGLEDVRRLDDEGRFLDPALEGTAAWCERFVNYWSGDGFWARLPEPQRAGFLASAGKMFQEARSLWLDRTPHQAFARIGAPTLVLSGSLTPVAGRHVAEIVARSIPGARLERLEGAGHMGPLTHAERVNRLVAEHIAAVERG